MKIKIGNLLCVLNLRWSVASSTFLSLPTTTASFTYGLVCSLKIIIFPLLHSRGRRFSSNSPILRKNRSAISLILETSRILGVIFIGRTKSAENIFRLISWNSTKWPKRLTTEKMLFYVVVSCFSIYPQGSVLCCNPSSLQGSFPGPGSIILRKKNNT